MSVGAVHPPPPLARLQPTPPSRGVLAPFDPMIAALRPEWARPNESLRDEVLSHGWQLLDSAESDCHGGLWAALQAAVGREGGAASLDEEAEAADLDDLPPWRVRS
jgi:hypothetical protein